MDGITFPEAAAWATVVLAGLILAGAILSRRWKALDAKEAERTRLILARATALAEGRWDDAAEFSKALRALGAVAVILVGLLAPGCKSAEPLPSPVTFGQRAFDVEPGQVVTIPPYQPGAVRWTVMDNVAQERLSLPCPD